MNLDDERAEMIWRFWIKIILIVPITMVVIGIIKIATK